MSITFMIADYFSLPDTVAPEEASYYRNFFIAVDNVNREIKADTEFRLSIWDGMITLSNIVSLDDLLYEYVDVVCENLFLNHISENELHYETLSEEDQEEFETDFRLDFLTDVGFYLNGWRIEMKEAIYDYDFCCVDCEEEPDFTIMNTPQVCVFDDSVRDAKVTSIGIEEGSVGDDRVV